jgi:predicted dehydrogenase
MGVTSSATPATPPTPTGVLLIGLGAIGQTHARALESVHESPESPDSAPRAGVVAGVVAGVDIDGARTLRFRGVDRPVYRSVREASEAHAPAIVVIATPTGTHASVCEQAARYFPAARLLVEKPAAATLGDARRILSGIGGRQPVDVAYHTSLAPEVTWGQQALAASRPSDLLSAESFFADPYYDDFERAAATLGNSWLDSGINALSVLARFATIVKRESLRRIGAERQSIFEAHLTCHRDGRPVDALLVTSWHVADPAKTTRLRYASGIELLMDHTAVAAYLLRDGRIEAAFGADRSIPRRDRHYRALYQRWLSSGSPTLPPETGLHLHELLLGELRRVTPNIRKTRQIIVNGRSLSPPARIALALGFADASSCSSYSSYSRHASTELAASAARSLRPSPSPDASAR